MALSALRLLLDSLSVPSFTFAFIMILALFPSISSLTVLVLSSHVYIRTDQLSRRLSFNYTHIFTLLISLIIKFLSFL